MLARYDIGAIRAVERQLKGSRRSPKVIITADRGQFLLKRRARGRDHPIKVAFSHAVQEHLAARGFPLPRLVSTRDDSDTMVLLEERIYEMFHLVQGGHYDRSVEAARDAGLVLGLFHRLLADYHSDWQPSRQGYHDAEAVRSNLNGVPTGLAKDDSVAGRQTELLSTVSSLYESYAAAAERVNSGGFASWPDEIVHSDWHPGNMLFEGPKVAAVIDYDSLHMLPGVTDLANGLLQFSIRAGSTDPRDWPAEMDHERFAAFLAGYAGEQPVGPDRRGALVPLMIEALIAEAVAPIAATGSFGRIEGFRFLQMISRKVRWLELNGDALVESAS